MSFWTFVGILSAIVIGASVYAIYRDQKQQAEEDKNSRVFDETGTEAPMPRNQN